MPPLGSPRSPREAAGTVSVPGLLPALVPGRGWPCHRGGGLSALPQAAWWTARPRGWWPSSCAGT